MKSYSDNIIVENALLVSVRVTPVRVVKEYQAGS